MLGYDLIELPDDLKFPSPYGVSFILIDKMITQIKHLTGEFPSPYGVIFILTESIFLYVTGLTVAFPSPYGVSFILMCNNQSMVIINILSFRLLMEYHSFLFRTVFDFEDSYIEFPSPYGVSFILIIDENNGINGKGYVSVSLWSIIHSYFKKSSLYKSFDIKVSVSLWSIIHSYDKLDTAFMWML